MNKQNTAFYVSLLLFLILLAVIFVMDFYLGGLILIFCAAFVLLYLILTAVSSPGAVRMFTGPGAQGFEYRLDKISEPVVLIDSQGNYVWYNNAFYQNFYSHAGDVTELSGRNIHEELNISLQAFLKGEIISYSSRCYDYDVVPEIIKQGGKVYYLLHFWRIKPNFRKKGLAAHTDPVFCYVAIDNYDEIMSELTSNERAQAMRDITVILTEWANRKDGLIIGYENDRYLVIFERDQVQVLMDSGFRILDEIRSITTSQGVFTLSIGLGTSEKAQSISAASDLASRALHIAQERGGDQAVIKHDGDLIVYGGRRETKRQQTKTKTRVKSEKLRELIENADNVLIVGHQTPDMDCFGAAVGLIDACRDMNKTARYIFGNKDNLNFELLEEYLSRSPNYDNAFILREEALDWVRDQTLLIVVDTRSSDYVDYPEILKRVKDIVVIDHHLQPKNVIEDTVLSYVEPAASSTSELVARILEYFDSKSVLTPYGANALMAGMYMDTRQFAQHIGVCTFEAAAYLTRKGAEMRRTRNLLRDDFVVFAGRSSTTRNAQFYYDGVFAVAMCEDYTENADRIKSCSADDLLNIKGVAASFVLLKGKDGISISARSSDERDNEEDEVINVCQILEALGGGGHMNMAGAQLHGITKLDEAKELLLEQIGYYVEERSKELESNFTEGYR